MLEASCHEDNSFLTLTYDDDHLPGEFFHPKTGELFPENSVDPIHISSFMKNLQKSYKRDTGKRISYFYCAEYGDKTGRPHYHAALFGFPPCEYLNQRRAVNDYKPCPCKYCSYIRRKWKKGNIYLGDLTQHSAQYVAGYVTKKLTSLDDPWQARRRAYRHPEFMRCSLKPALGKLAAERHAAKIAPYIDTPDDIPRYLLHNGKKWPLGRYLHDVYRKALGFHTTQEEFTEMSEAQKERKAHDKVLFMFEDKTLDPAVKDMVIKGVPALAVKMLNKQQVLIAEQRYMNETINRKGI